MINIKTYTLNASLELDYVYEFRGALLDVIRKSSMPKEEIELFTNKVNGSDGSVRLIERYAPIQCRCDNGLASIWAIDTPSIHQLRSSLPPTMILDKLIDSNILERFTINNHLLPLQAIDSHNWQSISIDASIDCSFEYIIYHFIPFNNDKIKEFDAETDLNKRVNLIEKIILNELVLFGYLYNNDTKIMVNIDAIFAMKPIKYKTKNNQQKVERTETAFILKFRTNIGIPDGISLGRHKAYGYGVVKQK